MSKRNGAKPVTQYRDEGFLPEAMVNYLARLGWSHGDEEIFTREQFLQWFDLDHLGKSAGQYDEVKLRWVNAQHIKRTADAELAPLVREQLAKRGIEVPAEFKLEPAIGLFKDRCATTVELADWLSLYFTAATPSAEEVAQHVTPALRPALASLRERLLALPGWDKAGIAGALKATLGEHGLKMPQLAIPVRLLVCGRAQTPSVDAVLELFSKEEVAKRLQTSAESL
jgi:glutamyl-tRNA synthetase